MSREGGSRRLAVSVGKIKDRMTFLNISRSALAKRAHITLKQVNNILDGVTAQPREDTITRIAGVLGVQWRTLLEEHEGNLEAASEGGGVVVQTTVDLVVETSDDLPPEELQRRLETAIRKAGHKRLDAADVIRIVKLRPRQ